MAATASIADGAAAPMAQRSAILPHQRRWITLFLICSALMNMIDTTIANVALPQMQGTTGASREEITWVLTSYIVSMAIAIPLGGWLSARFSRKTVLLGSIACFTLFSVLCGISNTVEELVLFRMCQGFSGAALAPIVQSVLLDIYPREEHGTAMAYFSFAGVTGPLVGPMLGGWLTANFSWGWVFLVNLPVGVIAFFGLAATMPRLAGIPRGQFDFASFGLLATGVAALQLMLDRGGILDWFDSPEIRIEALVSIATLGGFLWISARRASPFFPRALLLDRNFMGGTLVAIAYSALTFSSMAMLPEMLAQLYGHPVLQIGFVMAPRGAGTLISTILAPMLVRRVDGVVLIAAGLALTAYSTLQLSWLTLDADDNLIMVSGFLQGIGGALMWVPMSVLSYSTLATGLRNDGAVLQTLLRYLASAAGIAAVQSIIIHASAESHAELAAMVNWQALPGVMREALGTTSAAPVLSTVNAEVTRQATMVAYTATFRDMALLNFAMLPLLLLLRRRGPGRN